MDIRLTPIVIGNFIINRLAVLTNAFFQFGNKTANYTFNVYLVDEDYKIVQGNNINPVQQIAIISENDFLPAFENLSYAMPLIEAQSKLW